MWTLDEEIDLLWIDALCIWQDSLSERADGVAHMDEIYSGAEKVLIWLGADETFLESVSWLHNAEKMWEPVIDLLDDESGGATTILMNGGPKGNEEPKEVMENRWLEFIVFHKAIRWFQRAWVYEHHDLRSTLVSMSDILVILTVRNVQAPIQGNGERFVKLPLYS